MLQEGRLREFVQWLIVHRVQHLIILAFYHLLDYWKTEEQMRIRITDYKAKLSQNGYHYTPTAPIDFNDTVQTDWWSVFLPD